MKRLILIPLLFLSLISFGQSQVNATVVRFTNTAGDTVSTVNGKFWIDPVTSKIRYISGGVRRTLQPVTPFTLTNGSGTTANGTAVDLGGTLTQNTTIDANGNDLVIETPFSGSGTNFRFGNSSGDFPYGGFRFQMYNSDDSELNQIFGDHELIRMGSDGAHFITRQSNVGINAGATGLGASGQFLKSDGTNVLWDEPSVAVGDVTGLGTGVATALGTNVGSAGSIVVNGGALGTPSSGTGTNLTGIPQSGVTNLTSDLALKAPLASPALTGTPTAPTQTAGDNSTKIATTAYVDDAVSSAGGLPALGTALQQLRVNSGATDLEYFSPLSSPSTTDYDIIRWNAGTSQYNRLGLGTDGYYLGAVSGTLAYSDPTSRFWNLSGTSTFTGNSTIATGTNSLGFTTTSGFSTATTVLENFTNNGSQIYQLTANGAPKYEFFNTSGVKVGAATLTSLSAVSGLRMFNAGETAFYDFGYLGSNSSMYLLFNTAASTKLRIGSSSAGTGTLQVTGGGTTTATTFRVEDSGGNNSLNIQDNGLAIFGQRAQSATNTFQTFTQAAHTGGLPVGLLWTAGAHTGMTNGNSVNDWNINLTRTIQWSGNTTVANYRGLYLGSPTLSSTSSGQTVTRAATFALLGPAKAGTNNAITTSVGFDGESRDVSGGAGVTNAYTGFLSAPTGATNNYALGVLGSVNLSSTTSPILLNGSAGTSGQVLTTAGAGATPTWQPGEIAETVTATASSHTNVILSGIMPSDSQYLIEVSESGVESDGSDGYSFIITAAVKNDGGTLAIVGTNTTDIKSTAGTTATVTIVSNAIQLDVTAGFTAKYDYRVRIKSRIHF